MLWIERSFCTVDERFSSLTGISPFTLTMTLMVLSLALALSALVSWRDIFGVLRRAGFSRTIQNLVYAYLVAFPLVQVAVAFLRLTRDPTFDCPCPEYAALFATTVYFLFIWGTHVEKQNKGKLPKFLTLIVLPAAGIIAVSGKMVLGVALEVLASI